ILLLPPERHRALQRLRSGRLCPLRARSARLPVLSPRARRPSCLCTRLSLSPEDSLSELPARTLRSCVSREATRFLQLLRGNWISSFVLRLCRRDRTVPRKRTLHLRCWGQHWCPMSLRRLSLENRELRGVLRPEIRIRVRTRGRNPLLRIAENFRRTLLESWFECG